jgi:hypothetical protein
MMNAAAGDSEGSIRHEWAGAALGAAAAAAVWSPALGSPLWQEDYVWIAQARAGMAWPGHGSGLLDAGGLFWRPVGVGLYWRVAMALTGGSAPLLHRLGLLLHFLAFMAVGVFGARLAAALTVRTRDTLLPAAAGAFMYGVHSAHFLPTHWASGRQQTLLVLFEALALTGWLGLITRRGSAGRQRPLTAAGLLAMCIGGTAGALGSTEASVMLPVLGAILWFGVPRSRRIARLPESTAALIAAVAIVCMTVAWWVVRSQLVVPPAAQSPYAPRFGLNIPRNLLTLVAFAGGLPREGLRMMIEGHAVLAGAAWILGCVLLQSGAMGILARILWKCRPAIAEPLRTALAAGAFALAALAPYLPLARHCYAYYTLPALMTLAGAAAMAASVVPWRALRPAALSGVAAAAAAMTLEHMAPYPATLATARHAARTHQSLREQFSRLPRPVESISIDCPDDRLWYFMGWQPGIGDALGFDWRRISRVENNADAPARLQPPNLLRVRPPAR